MLGLDDVERAVEIADGRYALCVILAKRAKQIHRRQEASRSTLGPSRSGLGPALRQALDELLIGTFDFSRPRLSPTQLSLPEVQPSNYALLSLFALARANLEKDSRVYAGKNYSIDVGISSASDRGFISQPFEIQVERPLERIPFDFLIHIVGSLKLVGDYHQQLLYDPTNSDMQLVSFEFETVEKDHNHIKIDCFHSRRWLRTFEFEFDSIEIGLRRPAAA